MTLDHFWPGFYCGFVFAAMVNVVILAYAFTDDDDSRHDDSIDDVDDCIRAEMDDMARQHMEYTR